MEFIDKVNEVLEEMGSKIERRLENDLSPFDDKKTIEVLSKSTRETTKYCEELRKRNNSQINENDI